jgi:hypothetical protein
VYTHVSKCKNNKIKGEKKKKSVMGTMAPTAHVTISVLVFFSYVHFYFYYHIVELGVHCDIYKSSYNIIAEFTPTPFSSTTPSLLSNGEFLMKVYTLLLPTE